MEDGTVVPDGQVVLVPAETDLQVVIVGDELEEVSLENVAFARRNVVDPTVLDLVTCPKQTLPASHRVGADHGVRRGEVDAGVLWRPAFLLDQFFAKLLGHLDKVGLMMRRSQALCQLLERWGQAVVRLVARGPERVAARVLWGIDDLEDRIVGWDAFESDAKQTNVNSAAA